SIANKRVGQKYIFGGFKSLTKPFTETGEYKGDRGHTTLEIAKDFFVPTNLHGAEVFLADDNQTFKQPMPLEDVRGSTPEKLENENLIQGSIRGPASGTEGGESYQSPSNIFTHLDALVVALEN